MPIDIPHQNPMSDEPLKAPRPAAAPHAQGPPGGAPSFRRTPHLATSGVRLGSTLAPPPGTRVSLAVKLPGASEELCLEGEVVARHPEEVGMAVRFIALSERERKAIASVVRARAS